MHRRLSMAEGPISEELKRSELAIALVEYRNFAQKRSAFDSHIISRSDPRWKALQVLVDLLSQRVGLASPIPTFFGAEYFSYVPHKGSHEEREISFDYYTVCVDSSDCAVF